MPLDDRQHCPLSASSGELVPAVHTRDAAWIGGGSARVDGKSQSRCPWPVGLVGATVRVEASDSSARAIILNVRVIVTIQREAGGQAEMPDCKRELMKRDRAETRRARQKGSCSSAQQDGSWRRAAGSTKHRRRARDGSRDAGCRPIRDLAAPDWSGAIDAAVNGDERGSLHEQQQKYPSTAHARTLRLPDSPRPAYSGRVHPCLAGWFGELQS